MSKRDPWKTAGDLWGTLKPRAHKMRQRPTAAEALLWSRVRANQVLGFHFRRQHAIGPAIVDFCCAAAKLIVEVDGPIHERQVNEDRLRQQWLEAQGFRVLRFTNDRVLQDVDGVVAEIADAMRTMLPKRD